MPAHERANLHNTFVKTLRFGPLSAAVVDRPGRRARSAGGAPLADTVVGTASSTAEGKSRGVVFGLLIVVAGLMCSWVMWSTASSTEPYPDGQTLHGTVVAVDRHWHTWKSGSATLSCTVEVAFTLGDQPARTNSAFGTGQQCTMRGQQVDVSVRGADPATARVIIAYGPTNMWLGQLFAWFWVAIGAWPILHRLRSHFAGTAAA